MLEKLTKRLKMTQDVKSNIFIAVIVAIVIFVVIAFVPNQTPIATPTVVVVTATPAPVVDYHYTITPSATVGATQRPTATLAIMNPQAECISSKPFEQCQIFTNPLVEGTPVTTRIGNRDVQSLPGWTYLYTGDMPEVPSIDEMNVSPIVYCQNSSCQMKVNQTNGEFGFRSELVNFYKGQRYLLKVQYSVVCEGKNATVNNISLRPSVLNNGKTAVLPLQATSSLDGDTTSIWLLESDVDVRGAIFVNWFMPYAVCVNGLSTNEIKFKQAELFPVPQTYGNRSEATIIK